MCVWMWCVYTCVHTQEVSRGSRGHSFYTGDEDSRGEHFSLASQGQEGTDRCVPKHLPPTPPPASGKHSTC